MKFGNYSTTQQINEKYSLEMIKNLNPYLKEIGDILAKAYISVENTEFKDHDYLKPSTTKKVLSGISNYWKHDGYYNRSGLSKVIAIMKHNTGGVTLSTFDFISNGIAEPINIANIGDTSGKVVNLYTYEITDEQFKRLLDLRQDRQKRNKPAIDPHNKSAFIHKKLKLLDNINIKNIIKKAKELGFNSDDLVIKSTKYENFYLLTIKGFSYRLEQYKKGVPNITINLSETDDVYATNGNDYIKVDYHINASTFSFSNSTIKTNSEFNSIIDDHKKIIEMIQNTKKLKEYIETFTYNDILVE